MSLNDTGNQSSNYASNLENILGQDAAKKLLRASLHSPVHAYMFIGPAGVGKKNAALAFAASLLCDNFGCGSCPHCADAMAGIHRDLVVIEREGSQISVDAARNVVALAQRSPSVAKRQVIILCDFHLAEEAAAALLKTIEEPPESTVFIVLTEEVTPHLITVASRCVQIQFNPVAEEIIEQMLVTRGVDTQLAHEIALFSRGSLARAHLLLEDESFLPRRQIWHDIPNRLKAEGSVIAGIVDGIAASLDVLVEHLVEEGKSELAALESSAGGLSAFNRQGIEERNKRKIRRVRTDELKSGFSELIHSYYQKIDTSYESGEVDIAWQRVQLLEEASLALNRNPNEELLLTSLLFELARIN